MRLLLNMLKLRVTKRDELGLIQFLSWACEWRGTRFAGSRYSVIVNSLPVGPHGRRLAYLKHVVTFSLELHVLQDLV